MSMLFLRLLPIIGLSVNNILDYYLILGSCQYQDIKSSFSYFGGCILRKMESFNQHGSAQQFADSIVRMVVYLALLTAMASAKLQTHSFVVRLLTVDISLSMSGFYMC